MKKANITKPSPDQIASNSTVQASKINRKKIQNKHKVLSDPQTDEIKKAFDFFDITGSGTFKKNIIILIS